MPEKWVSSVAESGWVTKGEPAKYAEMIRHKIEAVVAIKNNGAALRHQIATNKNVVDPFV